jgi:hypothetical protein
VSAALVKQSGDSLKLEGISSMHLRAASSKVAVRQQAL